MAIVNRTLDASEQKKAFEMSAGAVATGVTLPVCLVPYPCNFLAAEFAAAGLSGSPTAALAVNRFIVGTGFTTWVIAAGGSNTLQAYGTSGPLAAVCVAQGSTLLELQADDLITVTSGGSNAAVTQLAVGIVLQPIMDIKTTFGQ